MKYVGGLILRSLLLLVASCEALRPTAHLFELEPRTSSGSGPQSKSPSPPSSTGKAPARDSPQPHGQPSVRLFGVNVAPGKPSSHVHPSQASQTHTAHVVSSADFHPQTKHGESVSHANVQMHPGQLSPQRTATTQLDAPTGKHSATSGPQQQATGKLSSSDAGFSPKDPWWKKKGGRPRATHGLGARFEIDKKYRERQKVKKIGQFLAESPFKHHHPHKGDDEPGSPGAGSHAVSR